MTKAERRFRRSYQSRGRTGRRNHQRRRRGGARILEADLDIAASHCALRTWLLRSRYKPPMNDPTGAWCLRRAWRRSDGRTCAGRCFSAKIWGRFTRRDAAEFRQLCPTNRRLLNQRLPSQARDGRPRRSAADGARRHRLREDLSHREVWRPDPGEAAATGEEIRCRTGTACGRYVRVHVRGAGRGIGGAADREEPAAARWWM